MRTRWPPSLVWVSAQGELWSTTSARRRWCLSCVFQSASFNAKLRLWRECVGMERWRDCDKSDCWRNTLSSKSIYREHSDMSKVSRIVSLLFFLFFCNWSNWHLLINRSHILYENLTQPLNLSLLEMTSFYFLPACRHNDVLRESDTKNLT